MSGSTMSRRELARRILGYGGRLLLGGGILYSLVGLQGHPARAAGVRGDLGVVRPPGAAGERPFLARCMRCTRCAHACPAGSIELFGPEAGILAGTPYLLPHRRGCTLCLACTRACPTGALEPLDRREQVRMGVAEVDRRLCVSHNGTGVCGACYTACPLRGKAITQDLRNAPVVHPQACVGCGLCEEVCIVRDRRAIRVRTSRRWVQPGGREG